MVIKHPLKEIFKIHGGMSGLTEKIIYENQAKNPEDNIPVFSSATDKSFLLPKVNKNLIINGKPIKTFSHNKNYIIITRNGKAGLMNIISGIDFTINDHAYVMELKKSFENKIDLEYFIFKYQSIFLNFVSSKNANGTFSKEIVENLEIEIDLEAQKEFISKYNKQKILQNKINEMIEEIETQLKKIVNLNTKTKKFLISELFYITTGKRITQKEVYNHPGNLPIVSAQTDNSFWYADKKWLSKFKKNGKSLIFNQPCITWVCVGRAGTMFYRDFEFFLTDNAGVLIPKNNNINLKWFIVTYQEKIRALRQGDRNGQSTMFKEHMANIEVEMPIKENGRINREIQDKIYSEYKRLINLKDKLKTIQKMIGENI